ncbi:MAG TPA: cyclic nucleotide-binding domain-containing protein [Candidatus Bathyarchaeia archaeon]|nr:cyclic nucleotide-binding domain-containing protein [Candidatus Bathyarchaeia archaeon]
MVRQELVARHPDGLRGKWLTPEDLAELDFFKGTKRAFKIKTATNFAPTAGKPEPGIKAAVRREFQKGDVIFTAGDYGSTAFLMLEGTALATIPERAQAVPVAGRTPGSLDFLARMFGRRARPASGANPTDAGRLGIGEVSAYASLACEAPPPEQLLRPGDVFGVDSCINFYPREATVVAAERCVAVEMLRSVLDTVRDAGSASDQVNSRYRAAAIRWQLRQSGLFRSLSEEQLERLALSSELLTNDSEAVRDDAIYAEGQPADALFLVRSGTVKLSQVKAGGELIFGYLGRGSAFGFENLLPSRETPPLRLRCLSHPTLFPEIELGARTTFGRAASCEVVFPRGETGIGRKHCKIEERDGEFYLTDLESVNSTLLNGERIQQAAITAGDRITVVEYLFELTRAPRPTAAGGAPPRFASARALDNVEIVRIDAASLASLAQENPRLLEVLTEVGQQLEAAIYQRTSAQRSLDSELVGLNLYNSQNTLLIDLERCTRCDECVKACSDAHGGVARFTRDGPRFGRYLVTMACRSCTDPKCMIGCPVGSIRRRGSLEIQIEDWCIGCERCANQCPFGNINMVERPARAAAAGPPSMQATVCDLCAGYDRPNCVYACPHDAAIRVNPSAFLTAADLS